MSSFAQAFAEAHAEGPAVDAHAADSAVFGDGEGCDGEGCHGGVGDGGVGDGGVGDGGVGDGGVRDGGVGDGGVGDGYGGAPDFGGAGFDEAGGAGWGGEPLPPEWVDPAGLDDEALVEAVRASEAVGRRLDVVRARLAAQVAERSRRELGARGLARRSGCRTGVELLQRLTGASGATVHRRIRVGRAITAVVGLTGHVGPAPFPHLAAALAAGTLGNDAAAAVVDTLRPVARIAGTDLVRSAERAIVADAAAPAPGAAPRHDADAVRVQATVWAAVLDPDGPEPSPLDLERRGLTLLAPHHGLVPVRGHLLPEVAAALRTYAHACSNPRTPDLPGPEQPSGPRSGTDAQAAQTGAGPEATACTGAPAPHAGEGPADPHAPSGSSTGFDTRSTAQQLHDVLAAIVGVAARVAEAPSLAGNAPTLVVTVRAQDLATGIGPAYADDPSHPLSSSTARHIGCAGAIQTVLTDASGRITGMGSPTRCFTGPQRRAIAARDGGCVIPGCHTPAAWCETHHVTPHATDPAGTHTDNGVLLCWYHHRTIDTSGWHIRMRDGLPQVRAPRWIDPTRAWRPARGSPLHALDQITRTITTPMRT